MSIGLTILFVSLMVVFNVLYFVSAKDSAFGGSHYYLVCSLLCEAFVMYLLLSSVFLGG